jgi:hypothetical protein
MAKALAQPGPSVQRDDTLAEWLRLAAIAAARLGSQADERLMEWASEIESPKQAIDRIRQLPRVLFDGDLVELNHQVTLAALLRGRFAATTRSSRVANTMAILDDEESIVVNVYANPEVFDRLPFEQAIRSLAGRLGLVKYSSSSDGDRPLPAFMALDAANRSRAFTMAWIQDLDTIQQVHDELVEAANNGETMYDWRMKHIENVKSRGWEGSPLGEWHYQLVYNQNLAMAYTAGRYEQGVQSGFSVVRILPTLSVQPRAEHAIYAGQMFQVDADSMLPPWDFGCNCGWEWVFPEELRGVSVADLPILRFDDSNQDFKWRPAAYTQIQIDPGQYRGPVKAIADDMRNA